MLRNTWFSISSSLHVLALQPLSDIRLFPHRVKRHSCFQIWKQKLCLKLPSYLPLISIPSKLLEHIVSRRLLHHLLDKDLLSPKTVWLLPWQLHPGSPAHCHPRHSIVVWTVVRALLPCFWTCPKLSTESPTVSYLAHFPLLASPAPFTNGFEVTSRTAARELSSTAIPPPPFRSGLVFPRAPFLALSSS